MLNFKNLEETVANLEKEIQTLAQELEKVKKEYHDELNPEQPGIREAILEKAKKRFKECDKGSDFGYILAENLSDEIDLLYAKSKRKLRKDSVVLKLEQHLYSNSTHYYFCTDRFFYSFFSCTQGERDYEGEVQYKDVEDIEYNNGLKIETNGKVIKISGDKNVFMFITDILDIVDIAKE